MAQLRVPGVPAAAPGTPSAEGRNRSVSVPNSFCFASDFLQEQQQQGQGQGHQRRSGQRDEDGAPVVEDAESWAEFLRECGVDPKDTLVAGAVRVTAKRQLKRQGLFLPQNSDVSGLSPQYRSELVALIREAIGQLRNENAPPSH